jgi:hypothetical protein
MLGALLIAQLACSQSLPVVSTTTPGTMSGTTYSGVPTAIIRPTPPQNQSPATPTTRRPEKLFANTCAAPCWQGITPGTTITDTIKIIGSPDNTSKLPYNNAGFVEEGLTLAIWGGVSEFTRQGETIEHAQVNMLVEWGIVRSIEFFDPDSREGLTDIVSKYGQPEFVIAGFLHYEDPRYKIGLFYPSKGLIFVSKYATNRDFSAVSKRDLVVRRAFIEPTTIEALRGNKYLQRGYFLDLAPSLGNSPMSKMIQWNDIPD